MLINIISIQKNDKEFKQINNKYLKLINNYAIIKDREIYNKKISLAQNLGQKAARKAYELEFAPYMKGFCIGLDERGQELNSTDFARLFEDKNMLSFFIGGAFGMELDFLQRLDFRLSFSKLTLAHKFVKSLLLEQIYRALCIKAKHPYHK